MLPNKNEESPPLNRAEALERVGDDESFLEELLTIYHEEFAEKSPALAEALANGDAKAVREIGHYLKGASANLSLPGLQAAAWTIEKSGAESKIEDAKAAYRVLLSEYERLKKFLGK
ncbi:MAG: Hpt domain-containing protein [Candidatus Aminicenantes bacterium]|nr:Hpt domain-containing protein [Candidatus Aminicenantes bacterium]